MAFSGGTFSRTFDCTTDRDNGVKILASKFDTELDGMATGLSTCILKDGTQTCTAAIPFAQGITLPDNKTIILGTNSDVTIQYDETTNDSLEIAANVEGAALGIVLKADQGDDAGDEWKLNIADGGTLTLGNDIASAGSYVTHLTITPNSTVSNSTTAVAGNLTVGGDLTLGSGAVITEAELEMLDGITAGTVSASKAMVVDANKDITGGRNLTISGELDAATLDISGDVDIDGTLETDALSIASTAVTATAAELNILDGVTSTAAELNILDGVTATTAELNYSDTGAAVGTVVASKVVTADANKDVASFRNITLTGELDAGSLDVSGDADIDGTLEADAMTLNGTAITATATLDTGISNNNVPKFTSGVADDDFLRVAGTAIEGRSAAEVLSDIGASAVAGSSSIVTTGALNAGSITSGFGAIDNGSSAITTTGVGSFGSLDISGDIDVDGTANLDVVDIDGALTQDGGAVFNEASADVDFRVESNGNVNMLFVDGGNDKVAIGHGSPTAILDVRRGDAAGVVAEFHNNSGFGVDVGTDSDSVAYVSGGYTQALTFKTNAGSGQVERMRINSAGNVGINEASPDTQLHISSGAPIFRMEDTDTSRYIDFLYGTRVATLRNTLASGEDMDTVHPEIRFDFTDANETRNLFRIIGDNGIPRMSSGHYFTLADDSTVTVHGASAGSAGSSLLAIYEHGTGDGALVHANYGTSTVVNNSNGTQYVTTDTDGKLGCILTSAHGITFKNRSGGTKTYSLSVFGSYMIGQV